MAAKPVEIAAESVQAIERSELPLPEGAAVLVFADLLEIALQRDVREET